jgi:aminobenzoyl-glutamate transport protein
VGKIRRQADLPQLMIEPMKEMAGFIVMVFPLAGRWIRDKNRKPQ